jgi:hypothetical protein
VEERRPLRRPLLLNCLDLLYGHALLKLLNAQHHLEHDAGFDLVVLVPRYLRWLVPDGVAAVWTVDVPLRRGGLWSDWLAGEVARRLEPAGEAWLSLAVPHPHPSAFRIERFTGVAPFALDAWHAPGRRPTVTYVWRDDRGWSSDGAGRGALLSRVLRRPGGAEGESQAQRVTALAGSLRGRFPALDFGVVGLGEAGGLPDWMADLRTPAPDAATERAWCARYADSHVVVGVHGSNMLLPSAHAGAVVELVPPDRWGNLTQDLLFPALEPHEAALRFRALPLGAETRDLHDVVASLLVDLPLARLNFEPAATDHAVPGEDPRALAGERARRWRAQRAAFAPPGAGTGGR